jgi:dihydrofolate synthase/folylpolyglutamate synthase
VDIDSILKPFQSFGVHLGLERIKQLLANLGNPHHRVPIIHVAGTNGKGSVCAYLSSVLTQAGYRVGRYTSPHLVDWTERICLNEQPISAEALQQLLVQVQDAIRPQEETPTQFEVITAAAWLYFAQSRVNVAVVEVGLGGRLDATNVSDRPLVTIITSISREHWQQLGPTLADIAREKAGILKPGCPAVVGQLPPAAEAVVRSRITELGCSAIWPQPAKKVKTKKENGKSEESPFCHLPFACCLGIEYPLPLLGAIQMSNSALAIAALQVLQQQGWEISEQAIASGMAKTRWLGRLQWTTWQNHQLLIDGAHNPAAAQALRQYVDTLDGKSVTWVMGMLSTKEHADIFRALLQPADRLYLVPVPDHSSADPLELAMLAHNICPELAACSTYSELILALEAAVASPENLIVLCGSLYLVGHFLRTAEEPAPCGGSPR